MSGGSRVESAWHRAKDRALAGQGSNRPPIGGSPWHERRTPLAQPTQIAESGYCSRFPLDEKFDIILCLGVFYHLIDPFFAFSQIRHKCHNESIVVLEGDVFFGLMDTPNQSSALYGRDVRRSPRFVPDPDTLQFLLNAAYFNISSKSIFALSKQTEEDAPPRGVNRIFLVCRPFHGYNDCYEYRPPFGLEEYDNRNGAPPEGWSNLYLGSR